MTFSSSQSCSTRADLIQRTILAVGAARRDFSRISSATDYMAGAWRVLTADGQAAAGRAFEEQPIHAAVVCLDPSQGGLAILDWLRTRYPHVPRIAAFPPTSHDGILEAANAANVYVAPEVPERELGHLIGRTVGLQARLRTDRLVAFAGSLQRIPSVPQVYAELRSVISTADFELAQVADVIGRDPGLSVKVLQVVNSAFYGLQRKISDLHHAVSLLGTSTITSLVLGITVRDQFSVLGAARQALEAEWNRALTVSAAAKRVAQAESQDRATAEAAYLAGLLHNVGRLILAANFSDRFIAIEWPEDRAQLIGVERSAFGAGHPELGALLLGGWGLDDELVEAVAFYAEPTSSLGTRFAPLSALHVAVALSPGGASLVDDRYLDDLDVSRNAN
jgi:HD-like signal output (HDOD) protein